MDTIHNIEEQRRIDLTRTALEILDEWGIKPDHQVVLLGLPQDTRPRALAKYRKGSALPDEEGILLRIHYLLGIHKAVCSLFPHNHMVGQYWITTPTRSFGGKSPLYIMLRNGISGMQRVQDHLNGTADW